MTDIFHEIEEEVRRERWEKLWKEYGDYIIAAAAFLVIASAGWQLWRYYEQRERLRASNEYVAAEAMLDSGQSAAAAENFGKLAANAPGGYASVARLQEAGALQEAGRTDDAVKLYKEIAAGNDDVLTGVARIRAGWAIVDSAPRSDVETLLAPLTDPSSGWNPMAREILAYADFRAGNTKQALAAYQSLTKNKDAPDNLRQRSAAMATYLTAGGGQNFGTVPPPPAPVKPAATTATPPAAPASQGPQKK